MNNVNLNRIGQIALWVVALGGLIGLMSFIDRKKDEAICSDVKIYMPGNQYFVERDEIDNILQTGSATLKGRRISNINIQKLEKKLQANPFVEFAKVYMDMDGIISVEVRQRVPILRVINKFGQGFYVDNNGYKLPLSANFTARVLVANGNIDELFANRVDTMHSLTTRDLYRTAKFIQRDSLWDAQIEELYVTEQGEIEMVPRVGEQRILLGHADSLERKFDNLYAFYKRAIPRVGWDAYSAINIKFANQVVGVRNNEFWKDSVKRKGKVPAPMILAAERKAPSTVMEVANNDPYIAHAEVNNPETDGPKLIMNTGPITEKKENAALASAIKKSVANEIRKSNMQPGGTTPPEKNKDKKSTIPDEKEVTVKADAPKKEVVKTASVTAEKSPVKAAEKNPVTNTAPKSAEKTPEKTDNKKAKVSDKEVIIKPIILDPDGAKRPEKKDNKKEADKKKH